MKELDNILFYLNGTVMKNRLPSEVKINKTSKIQKFKNMECGYFVSHQYEYDDTKVGNMDWCVGRIETLCIVSKIRLKPMKVARSLVESM